MRLLRKKPMISSDILLIPFPRKKKKICMKIKVFYEHPRALAIIISKLLIDQT